MNEEKLIQENIPLVKKIAGQYSGLGIPFEDLVQEGMVGILEAAKRFREDKGAKFSTYAVFWIKKQILQAIEQEKKASFNSSELIDHLHEDKKQTREFDKKKRLVLPETMPALEKKILILLYEEEWTLREIATEFNLSREKIRQLKEKGLRRLRADQKFQNKQLRFDQDGGITFD